MARTVIEAEEERQPSRRVKENPDRAHHQGLSKVDRYGWRHLDEPGELKMLPKSVLDVDHAYQRSENEAKVRDIAANFSWVAFGVLIVADRGDGRFYVIDGQHRSEASMRRSDVVKVPCIVFPITSLPAEAAAFIKTNTNRKPPTGLDKHKAMVVTGDSAAVLVERLVNESGRAMSNSAKTGRYVRCVRILHRWASADPDMLVRMYPIMDTLADGEPITEVLVDGLMWLESHMPDGESLADSRWRRRLTEVGYDRLTREAQRMSAAFSKGGAGVWARGMLGAINKGLRNRLVLPGVDDLGT